MAKLYVKENILEFGGCYYNYADGCVDGISATKPVFNNKILDIKLSDLSVDENSIKHTPLWRELFDVNINSRCIFIFNKLFIIKNYYILENPYSKFIINVGRISILVTIDNGYISSYETILNVPDNTMPITSIAWLKSENILIELLCYKLIDNVVDFKELDRLIVN